MRRAFYGQPLEASCRGKARVLTTSVAGVTQTTAVQIRLRRVVSLSSASEASSQLIHATRRAPSPMLLGERKPPHPALRATLSRRERAQSTGSSVKRNRDKTKSCSSSRRAPFPAPSPRGRGSAKRGRGTPFGELQKVHLDRSGHRHSCLCFLNSERAPALTGLSAPHHSGCCHSASILQCSVDCARFRASPRRDSPH